MSIDSSLIGSVINALPMDRMIAGPLQAMVQAQVTASKSYADFLMQVCVQEGKAVAIRWWQRSPTRTSPSKKAMSSSN